MKIFTIENETNNITVHGTTQDAEAVANAERFRNETGLNKLAADWPAARLVEIWNSLPGAAPVKKFKDRQTAVSRIWKALQSLGRLPRQQTNSRPQRRLLRSRSQKRLSRRYSGHARSGDGYARCATNARRCAGRGSRDEEDHAPQGRDQGPQVAGGQAAPRKQQDCPGGRDASARGGRHAVRDHGLDGLAKTHGPRVHAGAMKKAGYNVESFKPEGGERTYRINQ